MATAREEILAVIKYLKSHIVAGEAWLDEEAHTIENKLYEVFSGAPKIAVAPDVAKEAGGEKVFTGSINVGTVQPDPVAVALTKAEDEVKLKQAAAAAHAAEHGLDLSPPPPEVPQEHAAEHGLDIQPEAPAVPQEQAAGQAEPKPSPDVATVLVDAPANDKPAEEPAK